MTKREARRIFIELIPSIEVGSGFLFLAGQEYVSLLALEKPEEKVVLGVARIAETLFRARLTCFPHPRGGSYAHLTLIPTGVGVTPKK